MKKYFHSSIQFNEELKKHLTQELSREENQIWVLFYEYVKAHRKEYIFSFYNKKVLDKISSTFCYKEKKVSALSEQTRNEFHEVMNQVARLKRAEKSAVVPSDGATSRNSARLDFKNPVLKREAKSYNNPLKCISKRTFFCIMLVLFSASLWAMIFIPSTHWVLNKIFFFAKGDIKLIFMFLLFAGSIVAVNVSGYYDLEKIRKEEKELKK